MPFQHLNVTGGSPSLNKDLFRVVQGDGALVTTALHAGHNVPPELVDLYGISETNRLREEDPGTGQLAEIAPNHIIAHTSRFVVDLNRPRHKAVYLRPEDAWALNVWKEAPSESLIARSIKVYDSFYRYIFALLTAMTKQHGRVVLVDCHSYNHRRGGPKALPSPIEGNPDIDVEIDPVSRLRWAPRIDRLVADLQQIQIDGRSLDVRERIRFQPGHFVCWVNERFPDSVCAVAIEVKKIYMDEWTGEINLPVLDAICQGFKVALPRLTED